MTQKQFRRLRIFQKPALPSEVEADREVDTRIAFERLVGRIRELKRYDVGCADEGDGHLYNYADETKDGGWIKADDVLAILADVAPCKAATEYQ